jgi:hypothetical protein
MVNFMADLKDKIEFLKNNYKVGSPALEGQDSISFVRSIVEEIAADVENYNKYEGDIGVVFKAAMAEMNAAPDDSKHLIAGLVTNNLGITSALEKENETKVAIFEDYVSKKSDDEVFEIVDNVYSTQINVKNKTVELSPLIVLAKELAAEKAENEVVDSTDLIKRYFNHNNFTKEGLANVMGATLAFNQLNDVSSYNLTATQQESLNNVTKVFAGYKSTEGELKDLIIKTENEFSKFFYTNNLDDEANLHNMIAKENADMAAGLISGRDIGTPVKDTIEEKRKKQDRLDVELIEWEKKYQNYLKSLNNIQVMSATEKFAKRFATHGFAPKTSNLFGDSIVLKDDYGDPQKTLWNISALTGTMKLSRDVDYSNADVCQKTFAIAALNARRNGWKSVYLNHPGPDQEAKAFLKESVRAMVEIGKYEFEEIIVPAKYQHVIDKLKSDYEAGLAVIANAENSNKVDSPENTVNNPTNKVDATAPSDNSEKPESSKPDNKDPVAPSAPVQAPATEIPDTFADDKAVDIEDKIDEPQNDNAEFESSEPAPKNDNAEFEDSYSPDTLNEMPDHMKDEVPVDLSENYSLGNEDVAFDISPDLQEEFENLANQDKDKKPTQSKKSGPNLFKGP